MCAESSTLNEKILILVYFNVVLLNHSEPPSFSPTILVHAQLWPIGWNKREIRNEVP